MTGKNPYRPRELTDVFIRGFKNTTDKRVEIRDTQITGLVLRVTPAPSEKKTFTLLTRTVTGKKFQLTIGSYPVIKLRDARSIAMDHLAEVRRGHDPRELLRAARAQSQVETVTLAGLLDEVEPIFAATKTTWRSGSRFGRSKAEARAAIENVFSAQLDVPLHSSALSEYSKAVRNYSPKRPKGNKTTANGSAARALTYLRTVFDWASHRARFAKENAGRIQRIDLPDLSKILDPSLDDPALEHKRTRVLHQDELVRVLPLLVYPAPEGLRSTLDPTEDYGPIAFRFILLTLSRRDEVAEARRKDIDLRNCTWTKRVKTRRRPGSHGSAERRSVTTPLSTAAVKLLQSLPSFQAAGPDDYVFPSSQGGRCATGIELRRPSTPQVRRRDGIATIYDGPRRPSLGSLESLRAPSIHFYATSIR